MSLHRLTGSPTPFITEIRGDADADVVLIEHSGTPEVVYVLEPTGVGGGSSTLDGLRDVDGFATAPAETPLALRRDTDGVIRPDSTSIPDRPTRAEVSTGLASHVADASPHPAYDDLPSMKLIFENGLI